LTIRPHQNNHRSKAYNAASIEVLKGLDPVRRRPGMYTDTGRPNHLAQEVIDNSVDEAIAGHASRIDVILHRDGSLSVPMMAAACPRTSTPKRESAAWR
jgi:topoisomerase-4 subunit B